MGSEKNEIIFNIIVRFLEEVDDNLLDMVIKLLEKPLVKFKIS